MTIQETNSTKTGCVVPRHALNPIKKVGVNVCVPLVQEKILLSHQIALIEAPPLLFLSPVSSPRHAASRSNVSQSICVGHYYFSDDSVPPSVFPSRHIPFLTGGEG